MHETSTGRNAMSEAFLVRDIVEHTALGTRVVAGAQGVDRTVLWAHSCELPEPQRWLGPNELLMTVGLCIPSEEDEQVALIRNLDGAGLSGITIGVENLAPPLSDSMIREANSLSFPIMQTTKHVPFATIARFVAAANTHQTTQQVLTLSRLYQSLIRTRGSERCYLDALGEDFHVSMCAVDVETGVRVLDGPISTELSAPARLESMLGQLRTPPARMERVGRLEQSSVTVWSLPAERSTALLVDEGIGVMLDAFTSVHLGHAVAIEVNRRTAEVVGRAQRARDLFHAAHQRHGDSGKYDEEARALGIDTREMVLYVITLDESNSVARALALSGMPHGAYEHSSHLVIAVGAPDALQCEEIIERLADRAGRSKTFPGLHGLREAYLNAQWALDSVEEGAIVRYTPSVFSLMPRDESSANEVVRSVLGQLLHEDDKAGILVNTLCVFLDLDRNWRAAAQELGIHPQSLRYRVKRIEGLTGRSFRSSRDLAELWVARIALRDSL